MSCHIHVYHECGILKAKLNIFLEKFKGTLNLLYKYDKKVTLWLNNLHQVTQNRNHPT